MFNFTSHSDSETKKIATILASKLNKGDIVVLSGDLGAGKTKFTEGFLSFWGLDNEVSSPTFTIVNEYNTNTDLNIYHFDVYKLNNIDDFYSIGGPEYFFNGICIIEWGELLESILPENYIKIIFKLDDNNINTRHLYFEFHGKKFQNIIKELKVYENS